MVMTRYELPDTYYDDTDLENLYNIPVVIKNPTWRQQKEIELYKTLYRGILLVTGKARSGKDLFGVSFSYLNKLFFGRPVLLDFKPKRLFGDFVPFDPVVFLQIQKARLFSRVQSSICLNSSGIAISAIRILA